MLHRHCIDASETAISATSNTCIFPKASNIGQLYVAHSAPGTSPCFPPMTHSWSKTLCQTTRQPHQGSVTAACEEKCSLQPEWGISQHRASSCEPRVTSAEIWTAAHGASSAPGMETPSPESPHCTNRPHTQGFDLDSPLCKHPHNY